MNKHLIAELDVPDVQCDSDTAYWDRHQKIALQSLNMAFNNLKRLNSVLDSESFSIQTGRITRMVAKFNDSVQETLTKINNQG